MPKIKLVLLVANRTATTARLSDEVRRRAQGGTTRFHLVAPAMPQGLHRVVDPEVAGREKARAQLEAAIPMLSNAAGAPVTGEVGDADPLAAIHDVLSREQFDEIVVSTLPRKVSKWLNIDLPSKARNFGIPVMHLEAETVPDTEPPPGDEAQADQQSQAPASAGAGATVRDGMNQIVVTAGREDTLREAASRMTEQNVGAAVVVDADGSGLGIITERDVLRSIGRGEDVDAGRVGDHMTANVIYAHEDWSLESAAAKMTAGGFRHLIVLDGAGNATAILSMRDIVRVWTAGTPSEASRSEGAAA